MANTESDELITLLEKYQWAIVTKQPAEVRLELSRKIREELEWREEELMDSSRNS